MNWKLEAGRSEARKQTRHPGREIDTDQIFEITELRQCANFKTLYPHSTIYESSPVDRDLSRSPNSRSKMKSHSEVFHEAPIV
jgi:hypothetical protein